MRALPFHLGLALLLASGGLGALWLLVRCGAGGGQAPPGDAVQGLPPPVLLPSGFAGRLKAGVGRFDRIVVAPLADPGAAWEVLVSGDEEPWVLLAPGWDAPGSEPGPTLRLAWRGPATPLLRARVVRLLEALLATLSLPLERVRLEQSPGAGGAGLQPAGQDLRSWIRGGGPGQGGGSR